MQADEGEWAAVKFAPDAAMPPMRGVVMAESGLFDCMSPQPRSSATMSTTLGREPRFLGSAGLRLSAVTLPYLSMRTKAGEPEGCPWRGLEFCKRVSKKVEIGVEVYRRDKGVGRNVGV